MGDAVTSVTRPSLGEAITSDIRLSFSITGGRIGKVKM